MAWRLVVETIVVASVAECLLGTTVVSVGGSGINTALGELEERARASILHLLRKRLVPTDLNIRDRAASLLHRLFKVALGELRNGILGVLVHRVVIARSLGGLGTLDIGRYGLLDGQLDGALRDEAQ